MRSLSPLPHRGSLSASLSLRHRLSTVASALSLAASGWLALCPTNTFAQGTSAANSTPSVSSPEYQEGFQAIYESWRNALVREDLATWKASTAAYRQMEIKNRIISQKQVFPSAMFDVPVSAPRLASLNLVDIFIKGPTATAVYFGKLSFDGSSVTAAGVPDSFLVLRFAGEGDQWKFDNMRVIKISGNTDLLLQMRQGDMSFLQSLEFQPSGSVPPIAKPVSIPEYLGELWVSAIGFKAKVVINSQHNSEVINNTGRDLVIGGLKRGDNSLFLAIEPDPKADPNVPKRVEIAIYASKAADQPAERVYHYVADPKEVPPSQSATIRMP